MKLELTPIYDNISFLTGTNNRYIVKIKSVNEPIKNVYYITLKDNSNLLNIVYNKNIKTATVSFHIINDEKVQDIISIDSKTINQLEQYITNKKGI